MLPTASTSTREMGRTPPARHSSARPASGSIAVCSVCVRVRVGAGLVAHHVHLRLHVSRLPFWYRRKLLQECLVERVNPIAVHAASVGVSQTKPEDCDVGQPALPDGVRLVLDEVLQNDGAANVWDGWVGEMEGCKGGVRLHQALHQALHQVLHHVLHQVLHQVLIPGVTPVV